MWRFAQNAPGYLDVLRAAAANPALFSQPGALEGWLHGTQYWSSTTASARNWDWISVTDPAEASKQLGYIVENVGNIATRLGYSFQGTEYMEFANQAAREGWDEQRTRTEIMKRWALRYLGGNEAVSASTMPGELGDIMTKVYNTAFDYGVPLTPNQAASNAMHIVLGDSSEEAMQQGMRNWAKGYYAGNDTIISAIDQGFTVRQWADPYIQLASQELELNPSTIDFSDDKWNSILNSFDENGVRRPLSLNEATVKFRNDSAFGYDQTANGQQKSAQLTTSLSQMMGALG
jgi:hypothetical protein